MSEIIKTSEKRIESLLQFSLGIINGEDGFELVQKHKQALENITPYDMVAMEDKQLQMGITPAKIKKHIEKIMNVIYSHLKKYEWKKPEQDHPLYYLMLENRELEKILNQIKLTLRKKDFTGMAKLIRKLPEFNNHYIRKENILFPYLEKTWENYRPLQVMWSLHDDIRKKWKQFLEHIESEGKFNQILHKDLGQLFFLMYGMIFKEELVMYPIAMETVAEDDWKEMQEQSFEIGFSYITSPEKNADLSKQKSEKKNSDDPIDASLNTKTGHLNKTQIEQIFDSLPLDLTFIDEHDEVKYFNRPDDRFFPRSPAIIGRKVQNCHPPESVHIVEKILHAFKSGEKNKAEFRIEMKGKFILIKYFAVRNVEGKYHGTLEVSQDITEIRKLEGERRLLDWD